MIYPQKRNIHRPAHIYLDNEIYFVSCRTVGGVKYFKNSKDLMLKIIKKAFSVYSASIYAWVVLNNHYHVLLEFKDRSDELSPQGEIRYNKFHSVQFVTPIHNKLAKLTQYINRDSARCINKMRNTPGRRVWYQYFDVVVQTEKQFYTFFNYIHENPIKHGLVKNLDELSGYKYCSYKSWFDKMGVEWMGDVFRQYPTIDYSKWDD